MVNAWSLLYDELYGEDGMSKKTFNVGSGNTASMGDFVNFDLSDSHNNVTIDTSNYETLDLSGIEGINIDMDPALAYMETGTELKIDSVYAGDAIGDSVYTDTWPHAQNFLADNDDAAAHHFTTPKPGIESNNPRKYKEDESIQALKDYICTTYNGHYTSKENNVQTLDLIESVGDAEAFCRSNAIKYLSRYDKKGQAKRDILKALHYSLLLYHFSGQLNETTTSGYETF